MRHQSLQTIEGGTDEVRRLVRRDAEEDLFHELLHQRRQSHAAA
jgi:hypothetical protein